MPVSETPAVERIARVLAAQRLSSNADGVEPSAAKTVDLEWKAHRDDALAILRTLREPDSRMAANGDEQVWSRMIEAAIEG